MKFLADENFPRTSYLRIKQAGFDILSVGKDYAGITDESVMRIAIEEGRVILTFDSDFGRLIFEYNHKPESGVVPWVVSHDPPFEPPHRLSGSSKKAIFHETKPPGISDPS